MMARFRKKPVEVVAHQLTADNAAELAHWCSGSVHQRLFGVPQTKVVEITTLEGVMEAVEGDFIIQGVKGEFYPCKPDIFEATYERVEKAQ